MKARLMILATALVAVVGCTGGDAPSELDNAAPQAKNAPATPPPSAPHRRSAPGNMAAPGGPGAPAPQGH